MCITWWRESDDEGEYLVNKSCKTYNNEAIEGIIGDIV